MSRIIKTDIDFQFNPARNLVIQSYATDPEGAVAGRLIFNSTQNTLKYGNGSNWIAIEPGAAGLERGTSFPASPAAGDLFWRSDLGAICEYDGVRWLGPREQIAMPMWIGAPPFSNLTWPTILPIINETLNIIKFTTTTVVVSANNASNYWRIYATNSGTNNLGSTTTSNDTPGLTYSRNINIDNYFYVTSYLQMRIEKTGSPGSIYISSTVMFRRVY